jgi:hypothetical protein
MAPPKVRARRNVSKKKNRRRPQETSAVIEAMRNLRPSGEKSFEALIALLLSRLTDTRIRLCSAGTQGGIDAIAETPFAIEVKRYKAPLDTGMLVGGLNRAANKYPHLQLWVLAATCEVGVQTADELVDAGSKRGIAVLILDAAAAKLDLPGVSSLVAVAATDVETTTNILADPLWRSGHREPDLPSIEKELADIRNHPSFDTWKDRIRRDLRELPTWSYLVRRHNESLRSRIARDALNAFQTGYEPSEAKPRTAEAALTNWLRSCATSESCDVAVVTGDQGVGKTWLVYRWLLANIHDFSLPVFFFSPQLKDKHGEIDTLILKQAQRALGTFGHNAEAVIARQKTREAGRGPWCVVILDGANEYETASAALGTAVLSAMPPVVEPFQLSPDSSVYPMIRPELYPQAGERQSALLVTCRTNYFERDSTWLGNRKTYRVSLEAYDPREFHEAPEERSVNQEQSDQLDDSAISKPMGTGRLALLLQLLESEGFVARQEDVYVLNPEMIVSGMAEVIRRKLRTISNASEFPGALSDVLGAHRDGNEKVRWLRAAVTTSIAAGDAATHPKVVEFLISEWLSSQEFSERDLDELINLTPLLIDPVLQLTSLPTLMSSDAMTLAEPIIHDAATRHMSAVTAAVRKWFRLCPMNARWYFGDEYKSAEDVANAVADPSFADLGLVAVDSDVIRQLQRLGLYLADAVPSLGRPIDVLALLASRNATDGYLDEGERFAVREILAGSDSSWFEHEVGLLAGRVEPRTTLLRELIEYSGRRDLRRLLDQLPEPQWRTWREALTLRDLSTLQKLEDPAQVMRTAETAGHLALDPVSPMPPRAWRTHFANVAREHFGSATLSTSRSETREDLDLRDTEPALAAWAPSAGAHIWRRFLAEIPRLLADGKQTWSRGMSGHEALLTVADRRALLAVVPASASMAGKNSQLQHAFRQAYETVLSGVSSSERLRLLLDHPFGVEWTSLYEVVAAAADDSLRQKTRQAVALESDPLRLQRARILLGFLGGVTLSATDIPRLVEDVSDSDSGGQAEYAARLVLRNCPVDAATATGVIGRLVRTAESLSDQAWQYVAYLDRRRRPDAARSADWFARALSAPETARRNGAHSGLPDDVAVTEGIERLGLQILESLEKESPTGRTEQFPKDFADEISEVTFEAWIERLLVSPFHTTHFHSGLLPPVVRRALRTRHPAARKLWELAYPFVRGRFSGGTRFTVYDGVDWTLEEIHDPTLDNELAVEILRDLVADCRSDSELVAVALGARLASTSRLPTIVAHGFGSEIQVERAKARFLAGWMAEDTQLVEKLGREDDSRWVTEIGRAAVRRLDRERWAREWLRRFLTEKSRERRWAAGRLFFWCSDAATKLWGQDVLADGSVLPNRRAEAHLLIRTIRKKVEDSELRDNFLGHRVGDLAGVVHPWRQKIRWADIDITEEPHGG